MSQRDAKSKSPAKVTKKKPTNSPNNKAPKRPKSAYIIFLSENRERIKKANPTAQFLDIPAIAAGEWKSLKPAQKGKYDKLAEQDRERYKKEMLNYVPGPDDKKKKKGKKNPDAPKKPKMAYNFYVQSRTDKVRQSHPNEKMSQILSLIAAEWKKLSDRDKEPFVKLAEKDKQRYEKEVQA
ncbi:MAG TPA: hypothetical protein VLG50_08375 [Candidatus Saccharimonadales bacterium]|nr:hypothetical protein [Candidatus Saccharimonadales bacterium]